MTLIIAATYGHYAFHASDRLVTISASPKNQTVEWDIHSNKTVVAIGSDCWLVIGYTGLAYLDEKPTDQFIAEAISGYENLDGVGSAAWFPAPGLHYREIMKRIGNAIHGAFPRLHPLARKHDIKLAISGLQRKRDGNMRTVLSAMRVSSRKVDFVELGKIRRPTGNWELSPAGTIIDEPLRAAMTRLKEETFQSPEQIRDILMDAVQQTGELSPVVGEDVMGVILDNSERRVNAHFRVARKLDHQALVESIEGLEPEFTSLPTVATPYFLGGGMVWAPGVHTHGWSMWPSGITFDITGFDSRPQSGRAFFAAQPRRLQP